jgi:DNA-binding NtrC family response regulator
MPHRILIVDDDREFNTLLTDVYRQARYEVVTANSAVHGLELFRDQDYDLIVTDQRMPDMSGLEFIREVYEIRTDIPIIVVSGYLDSRTIRELIREGVSGVFMKPLNIFSLLKRSTELIQKQKLKDSDASDAREGKAVTVTSTLPFHFKTFPARASASLDFARKAYGMRDFNKCLLVIGEDGSDFVSLAEDFSEWQGVQSGSIVLTPESVTSSSIISQLNTVGDGGVRNITLVLLNADKLTDEQRQLVYDLASCEGDFDSFSNSNFRFMVCLNSEVDALYDQGLIDETFYIFLGSKELTMPPLKTIPEDIPLLAAHYLKEVRPDLKLDYATHSFLIKKPWKKNSEELKQLIQTAAEECEEGATITEGVLQKVLKPKRTKSATAATDENPLLAHVRSSRDEFARAVLVLCRGNNMRAAKVLDCREDYLDNIKESGAPTKTLTAE